MASKKQRAKELYESKQFTECKELLSEIIQDGKANHIIYHKMALISMELFEYDDAEKYFKIALEHRGKGLDPSNDLIWFNYGKLMHKLRNFDKALQCYSKCIVERASVHYHYAKTLLSVSTDIAIKKAQDKLQRATTLKPDIAAYHHELALCLIKAKEYDAANQSFTICLHLSNHKDIHMLYDYTQFLLNIYKDHEKGMQYQQMVHNLDTNHQYKEEHIATQLLIYGFDECIAYWNLNNMNMEQLEHMQRMDIAVKIFGGMDRIHRLKTHFKRIANQSIPLAIISVHHPHFIIYALKRVDLYHPYLENTEVIYMDTSSNIEDEIMQLSNRYNIKIQNILFIHSVFKDIELASNHCGTYRVFCDYILNGLTLKHMIEIERLVGIDVPLDDNPVFDEKLSLLQIDKDVYDSVKSQVRRLDQIGSIHSLPVIQWIKENSENDECKDAFIHFALKYKESCQYDVRYDPWSLCNILPQIIKLSPTDSELAGRYAQCLACLAHYDVAEHYFKMAIEYRGKLSIYYHLYAYFLCNRKRFVEAEKYFVLSMGGTQERHYFQSCLGYARTLEQMEQHKKADYYYRKATECKRKGTMEYFYGIFLFNHRQFMDAKNQFEIAVKYYPKSATNHFWLSKTLVELNNFEAAEYHSHRAFRLDPHSIATDCTRHRNENDSPKVPCFQYKSNKYSQRYHRPNNKQFYVMEKHRHQMQIIAQNMSSIPLDKLPDVYGQYFHCNIKSVYHGKLKQLAMYFDDLFVVTHVHCNNQTVLISKIYNQHIMDTKPTITNTPHNIDTVQNGSTDEDEVEWGHLKDFKPTHPMERYRKEMEIIGKNERYFNLAQLPLMYVRHFNRPMNCSGKCKQIVLYFEDIFILHQGQNNQPAVVSKIYKNQTNTPSKPSNNTRIIETPSNECNEDNISVEFKRFWFNELSISTNKSFNIYYDDLVKHKMNDISCLFDDEIQSKLHDVIGVKSLQDLHFIMTNICSLKQENKSFIEILKSNNLDFHYPMFTENGIYTTKSLKCHIKCRKDIQEMVASYTPGSNDDSLITSIWNIRNAD